MNPDPRPGRWILPLVVLGMIAFTYFFVKSLPGDQTPPEALTTGGTVVTTTSTTLGTSTTTSTTVALDPAVKNYLETLDTLTEQLTGFQTEMAAVNSGFDAKPRTIPYSEANDRLSALADNVEKWRDAVAAIEAPAALEANQAAILAAAEDANTQAHEALRGLRLPPPDTGELRRAAVAAFDDAVAAFKQAVSQAKVAAGAEG